MNKTEAQLHARMEELREGQHDHRQRKPHADVVIELLHHWAVFRGLDVVIYVERRIPPEKIGWTI